MVSMGDEQHLPLGTIENQHVVNCISERVVYVCVCLCVWLGGCCWQTLSVLECAKACFWGGTP